MAQYGRLHRKILLVALTVICGPPTTGAQGGSDEISTLVAQLSPDTVYYMFAGGYCPTVTGEAADRLVAIGRSATLGLLGALTDRERAVPANLVLNRIWYPKRWLSCRHKSLDPGEEITGYKYELQGLRWTGGFGDYGVVSVDPESLNDVLQNWCHHVPSQYRSAICQQAG